MPFSEKSKQSVSREVMAAIVNLNSVDLSKLVTKMNGEELFGYVNEILGSVGPVVSEYRGSIVKIAQDGIEALFEESCEDALNSAVTVCQRIASIKNRAFSFTDFTVGLNYGSVYSSKVGYGDYSTTLSISQSTKIAARLQELAARYGSHILITESVAEEIPDFFAKFNSRCLGGLLSEELDDAQTVYDVFDGDPIEIKNSKRRSKLFFETGVRLFGEKRYTNARSYFIELIKTDRNDLAAREYLYLCDRRLID